MAIEEEKLVCKICNNKFSLLTRHIEKTHHIQKEEYLRMFPGSKMVSDAQHLIMSDLVKKIFSDDPVARKRMSDKAILQFSDPKAREALSMRGKKRFEEDPILREKTAKRLASYWENEEFSTMVKENLKSLWDEPWYRELESKKAKEQWKNPEYRKMMSEKAINQFTDFDFYNEHGTFRQYFPYSVMFTHKFRESKRKEYDNTCPITGMTNEEHKVLYGRSLTVHHGNDNKLEEDPYWFIPMNIQIHSFITSALNHEERLAFIGGYLDDHEEKIKEENQE